MNSPFAAGDAVRIGRLVLILVGVAWLPVLALTLANGTAYGSATTVPLLGDFLFYGRFLFALPLLVLLHPIVDRRIGIYLGMLGRSGLVAPADEPSLQRHLDRIGALWRSRLARLVLLGASIATVIYALRSKSLATVSSWAFRDAADGGELTAAGWWSLTVGGPIVRFLLLMAVWKLLLWYGFLFRLARMPLRYEPLHPDRCAGLGFLDWVQTGFAALVAALSVQLGCLIADAAAYRGTELLSFKLPAAAFVVLMLALLFAPLLAFMRPLARACERTESVFHVWASRAGQQLGARMHETNKVAVASHLASPETSSLTDATTLYEGTVRTRRIPISARALRFALAAAVLPMAVPLLPLLPLKEIMMRLVKIVL